VSRLMDCVGCDKCRLWGKLQTAGYGAALKVLFETDNDGGEIPALKRTELVALFNTYARLSSSLRAIQEFRLMADEQDGEQGETRRVGVGESVPTIPDPIRKPHRGMVVSPETVPSSPPPDPDFDDMEDPSIGEVFDQELDRVIKAFRLVVRGWISFPKTLWHIVISELSRLWQFYIGLPVEPRTWKFQRPRLDEL